METRKEQQDKERLVEERREFLKNAGKAGLALPATALLVSVSSKRAKAQGTGSSGHGGGEEDRFSSFIAALRAFLAQWGIGI